MASSNFRCARDDAISVWDTMTRVGTATGPARDGAIGVQASDA
jgi:hypothetical protein